MNFAEGACFAQEEDDMEDYAGSDEEPGSSGGDEDGSDEEASSGGDDEAGGQGHDRPAQRKRGRGGRRWPWQRGRQEAAAAQYRI